ncbi:calmin [Boleophthalmus pectinirostris]|uniref:calmin n=1 Tax=Boleophthalmus pectinirostris TaxID=150288 RepID=UPI00242D429C|nr:calmin [Boleophthalmus pectinirostris]
MRELSTSCRYVNMKNHIGLSVSGERESVQKRTFTRWMNLHLEKCNPPIEVQDLFRDIQDGHILMALLEELSGCKLLHGFKKSSHRIFRLNNIAKVLSFLEERNVKLVSIDAADVADGNASIILGLIWNIILFFQIKELTGNIRSQFPSCSSLSSLPNSSDSDTSSSTPSEERQPPAHPMREHSKAIKKLLQWVQRRTRKYGVAVQDFGKSWTSGLAFLAVIKSIDSSLVDMRKALLRTPRENLEDAFRIAHYSLGIPRLLEPEDVTLNTPDEQSIIMYVSQFLEHFPGIEEPEEPLQVIERSISMGRLNFRETDADHFRNRGGRVRERSYMFQKDSSAPPPKILISSVSEDRGIVSPPFRQAATRSWSTEEFLSNSSNVEEKSDSKTEDKTEDKIEDGSSNVVSEPQKDTIEELSNSEISSSELQCSELRDSNSPTDSALPESVIGDSAVSSPDSWMESEYNVTPEKFSEIHSDGSLFDSGTAWDIYRATPVEITNSDEGLAPSEDRLSDEQQESYIDEGICSLSSLESAQERVDVQEMKQKEGVKETGNESQGVKLEQLDHNEEIAQIDRKVGETEKASESNGLDNDGKVIDSVKQPETEEQTISVTEVKMEVKATAFDVDGENGQSNVENDTEVKSNSQVAQNERPKLDSEGIEEVKQDDASVESSEIVEHVEPPSDFKDDLELCDDAENAPSTSQESTPNLAPIASMTIPLISISSEPDDQCLSGSDLEENFGSDSEIKEPEASAENEFENHGVIASCFITENIDLIASEETSDFKRENLNEEFEIVEEYVEIIEDVVSQNVAKNELACSNLQSDEPEMVILVSDQPGELRNTISASGESNTQEISMGTLTSNGSAVSITNDSANTPGSDLYKDYKEELVDLEPMDLFYPDKDVPPYLEPTEDVQSWPSVLSVSPLQPAPASQDPSEEQTFTQPDEYWSGEHGKTETAQMPSETQVQVPDPTFDPQDWFGDVSVKPESNEEDIIDLRTAPSARETTDPMRSYINSCSTGLDGNQIPTVLRHRKGLCSSQHTDNQRSTTSAASRDHISDYGLGDSWEPYVLLLLWLLLYCFWVLPQLDLKAVPSLFFNIRH